MPLTAAEWLRKTCPGATLMSFIEADEYAAYVTSFVPDDVEKAISDYEDTALKMYNEDGMSFLEVVAEAARYGASLAGRMEAVAFGDWIMKSGYIEHNAGDDEWTKKWVLYTSDNDQEYVTTEMLYSLFKKESNG